MNLATILHHAEKHYGSRLAVCCRERSWTYAQFADRVRRAACILQEKGIGAGAPVAILHRNCHCYLEVYFAAALLDALCVPLNYRLSIRNVDRKIVFVVAI